MNPSLLCLKIMKTAALEKNVVLQSHQVDLVNKSRHVTGMVANWRTGGGKTPGSIAVAEDRGGHALVVVPAALRPNYQQAVHQFTTPDRHNQYTIMSYEKFSKDPQGIVKTLKPNTVIADEIHRLRNPGNARKAFESVREDIPFMLGNTASLINNRPEELVPIVNLVSGKKLYNSSAEFQKLHLGMGKVRAKGIRGYLPGGKADKEVMVNGKLLKNRLGPYVHKFQGDSQFQSNFPDVEIQNKYVELTDHQRKLMKEVLKANPELASKIKLNLPPNKRELGNMNAFSVALRQIANDPSGFDTRITDKVKNSPKFQAMIAEQHAMAKKDPNFRSVVYSSFLDTGVRPVVENIKAKGVPAEIFQGGMSDKKRAQMVKDFNEGKIKTLGISPAGGEGLDLKGTKLMQLTEGHWNPERENQVKGRGVRFKSHSHLSPADRKVVIQRYIARNPKRWYHKGGILTPDSTIDEWIDTRRAEKEHLNQQFVKALG